jgi:adenylate cyclase
MNIDYVSETAFPIYSASDVLNGKVPPEAFQDKIVLVGATALGLGDQLPTPIDKSNKQPGVEVHANALNTMLTGKFVYPQGKGITLAWVFVLALALALSVAFLPIVVSLIIGLAVFAGYFAFAFATFRSGHIVNMVYPPLGVILSYFSGLTLKYFTEVRERKYVTNVFGRYLAKDVVQEVLSSPQAAVATLVGVSRPLGVLFADLRGFTAASEKATPPEVVAALNVYLEAMTCAVVEERGTIDKFMGDCVMAFWGAPRSDPDYAVRAVRAAMRMQDYIDEAMKGGPAAGLKVKGCGVGVSAGDAVVGNIGSHERLDYTAIGDTVNTASRICGVAGSGEIVVTEGCAELLGDEFRLSELPPLSVKGKELPLRVFQLLRPGQEAKVFAEGHVIDATEEKGHFEPVPAPPKVAGYAPVEPAAAPASAPASDSTGD